MPVARHLFRGALRIRELFRISTPLLSELRPGVCCVRSMRGRRTPQEPDLSADVERDGTRKDHRRKGRISIGEAIGLEIHR